ncbi:MAG TPA: methyltransferase domain-containing protein [Ruminiclostridium sp.]|nr:methyltransferase domain-containing protein [Ruminiclostridium sp.]
MGDKEKRVAVFSKGDDKFISEIIERLSDYYDTQKVTISTLQNLTPVDKWMEWADICWFEWCDELLIYASGLEIAKEKIIICRLHSYEAFTNYPAKVNWNCVDRLIFVSETIRRYVIDTFGIDEGATAVIPNGVDMSKYNFRQRSPGFNVAYVGYINYKKGPMLLLQTFKAIYDRDSRYKLFIAGQFQDPRYLLYFRQMVKKLGLEENYFFEGWQNNIDRWLEDKDYILCTSVLESQNMSVMQAMAKGIKPVIHNFVGASQIYPDKYLWNTVNEAAAMACDSCYNSGEYRDFVAGNYSMDVQFSAVKRLIDELETGYKTTENPAFQYIINKMNEFLPYSTKAFDSYDFSNTRIILGKREKGIDGYELIEFILENSQNEKLVINNIWYDIYNKKFIIPKQMKLSGHSEEIRLIAERIHNSKLEFQNNMAGFIFDPAIREDVKKNSLAYTWERGIPASQYLPLYGYLRIAERYTFAAGFIKEDSIVLEAPCGFGYGGAYLSGLCKKVEALDIAKENIIFAKQAFRQPNINWTTGDVTRLPYDAEEFDVYVSYEVFEHLPVDTAVKHIEEAYRVLKKSGRFIISTPNRAMRGHIHNPYHIKEYTLEEFHHILKKVFDSVEFYSVRDFQVERGIKETAAVMIAVCEK